MSNPEEKLRNLDFSFQYPENVEKVYIENRLDTLFRYWTYTVNGLKKAVTREERLRAMRFSEFVDIDYIDEIPLTYKLIKEEHKRFGLKPVGRRKAK